MARRLLRSRRTRARVHGLKLVATILTALAACGPAPGPEQEPLRLGRANRPETVERIEVPPPPFTAGAFPCTDCHDDTFPVNANRRRLRLAHGEIVLQHDEEHRWCLDCHSAEDRDRLHLASGERIEFTESYRLCGQCHGDKYRDWRVGVHGRRSGEWNGHKTYLLCVHCHNSHAPALQPLEPNPPPHRPAGVRE